MSLRKRPLLIVTCAICGYTAQVNPAVLGVNIHRALRPMYNPPTLWICDTHQLVDRTPHQLAGRMVLDIN